MAEVLVRPPGGAGAEEIVFQAPISKSLALRALAAAAVRGGGGVSGLDRPWPQDIEAFVAGLRALGAPLAEGHGGELRILGPRVNPEGPVVIHAGEGAAPARFLLALGALLSVPVTVEGTDGLNRRPMGPLLDALARMGAEVTGGPGLPATVKGPVRAGRVLVEAAISSQFISALLLMGAGLPRGLVVEARPAPPSVPYLSLTNRVLRAFGHKTRGRFEIIPSPQQDPPLIAMEADWSGGTILLSAAAFLGVPVRVPGLPAPSPQPDHAFIGYLQDLGLEVDARLDGVSVAGEVLRGGVFDLRSCPDSAPALAALGALAPGPLEIRGAPHLRYKESDRVGGLVELLRAVGLEAEPLEDGLRVSGGPLAFSDGDPVSLDVRADHRLAMAGALLGLRRPVLLSDGACVAKSFPGFFDSWPGVVH